MNKYLKFEYWNTCDLGKIYYQGGQHFWFYLDGDVLEPFHEETEDGQENGDGTFIPTYRKGIKRYRIRTSLVPDYLIDAMQRMKLHDNIELTFKTGEIEQIYNVEIEAEWVFEKYLWQAIVTLTFDMDESITVGACCDNLVVQTGDLYWVAETGSDVSGDGSYDNPWATLHYACTQATTSGDVIHIKAGTITETEQSALAAGVSIIGAGDTSIITTTAALDPIILMASGAEATDGNQSISYIKIDGDLTAVSLIKIFARKNVSIHHCTFIDALYQGVLYYGRIDSNYQMTTILSTGNTFHHNVMNNCGSYDGGHAWDKGRGNFCFGGQKGMLIYNNTITQPDRGGDGNGYGIKFTNHGNHEGTKIYNNTISVPRKNTDGAYPFAMELWSQRGGIEIYDNIIQGTIDVGGYDTNDDGGYGYALKIYDNELTWPSAAEFNHYGIDFELGMHDGIYVYRNYFDYYNRPIKFSTTNNALVQGWEDIYIYYNIFNNVMKLTTAWGGMCVDMGAVSVAVNVSNIQVLNNVAYASASNLANLFKAATATTVIDDVIIRNNIVVNGYRCVSIENIVLTNINVDNNDFYNCSAGTYYAGSTVTGDTYNNNITTDPTFVTAGSDFHLQAGSPCINAGIDVGLTEDYDGQAVGDPPEIGAYEY